MLGSFILVTLILASLSVAGFWLTNTGYENWRINLGIPLGVFSAIGALIFFFSAGLGGEFGYNTYTETPTTNFAKAMANDHSSVTIVYNGKPWLWEQYNIVSHFNDITNIIMCERKSVLGCQTAYSMRILTPPNVISKPLPESDR